MRDLDKEIELLLPEVGLDDLSLSYLRQQLRYGQRLPSIPGLSVDRFFLGDRTQEAADYAAAIGIAYEEDRQRNIIMRAKARAEAHIAQAIAEGRL